MKKFYKVSFRYYRDLSCTIRIVKAKSSKKALKIIKEQYPNYSSLISINKTLPPYMEMHVNCRIEDFAKLIDCLCEHDLHKAFDYNELEDHNYEIFILNTLGLTEVFEKRDKKNLKEDLMKIATNVKVKLILGEY